jgi:transmembrane sensor
VANDRRGMEQDELLRAAAEWSVELASEDIAPSRIAQWQQWLAADESHRDAFDRIQATLRSVDRSGAENIPLPSAAEMAGDAYDGSIPVAAWRARLSRRAAELESRRHAWMGALYTQRRRLLVGLAASVVAAVAVATAYRVIRSTPLEPTATIVQTRTGENREVHLADGSIINVGAGTMLQVTLDHKERSVTLERGEAFFRVAKDPARPFTVEVGDATVAAVGTAFNIRRAAERVVVAVAEGIVKVDALAAKGELATEARLGVGEQLSINISDGSTSMQVVDADDIAIWRDGLLQYRDEPLPSVIADVARYAGYDIVIGDAAVAELRVTGTVFSNDVDSWLLGLEAALPVRAVRAANGAVRLESISRR